VAVSRDDHFHELIKEAALVFAEELQFVLGQVWFRWGSVHLARYRGLEQVHLG
jgi:hypothetical protein